IFEQPDYRRHFDGAASRMDGGCGQLLGCRDTLENQHQCSPGGADVDRFVARVEYEHGILQSAVGGHGDSQFLHLRSTLASVASDTDAAPARFRTDAHAVAVAPVVITSSIRRILLPFTSAPSRTVNAPVTL